MRIFLLIITIGFVFGVISCTGVNGDDDRFENIASQYIQHLLKLNPEWATIST